MTDCTQSSTILCHVCTESLVELKKQRLLVMLHPTEGEEQVGVASTAEPSSQSEEGEEEAGSDGEVVGMKCRAPLKEV